MNFFKSEKGIPGITLLYLIIGLVVFGLIVIVLGANLFWIDSFTGEIRDRAVNRLINEATMASKSVEYRVRTQIDKIEDFSQNYAFMESDEDRKLLIDRFLRKNQFIKEISIIDIDGKEIERSSRGEHFSEKYFRDFSLWYEFETAKSGDFFFSNVYFTDRGEPYVIITTPIKKTESRDSDGVLRALFYLRGLWEGTAEMKIDETGRVMVVDDKGMLVADPNPSRVLKKINLLSSPPVKPILRGEIFRGGEYFAEDEKMVIGVGSPLNKIDWGVVVEQDLYEIRKPIEEFKIFTLAFSLSGVATIIILLILAFVTYKANKVLIKNSIDLKEKNKELQESKTILESKVEARTKELKEANDNLEKEVEKRTSKIEEQKKEMEEKVDYLERFGQITVGREIRMKDLKEELEALRKEKEELEKKLNER